MKTGSIVQLHFGGEAEQLVNDLPSEGFLLPSIAGMKESDRGKAVIRRCRLVKVSGGSLHSYRCSAIVPTDLSRAVYSVLPDDFDFLVCIPSEHLEKS